MVREVLHVPIVGTVPAIKPAAAMTRTRVIGLLGTNATIRQGYVDRLEAQFAGGRRLIRHAAPGLVAAAEQALRGEAIDPVVFAEAAEGLRGQPGGEAIDTVVLACTHFPLVEAQLGDALGPEVRFVHGAEGIARRIAYLTKGQPFARTYSDLALFTGDPALTTSLVPALRRYGLDSSEAF
jgi:glutamate racemase